MKEGVIKSCERKRVGRKILINTFLIIILIFMIVLQANLTSAAVYNSTEGQTVYECGNITEADLVYDFNQSFSTTVTCMRIQANNITLDFNGYNVTGASAGVDEEFGVDTAYNDTIIIDGIITGFTNGVRSMNNYKLNISGGNYSGNGPDDDGSNDNDGFNIYLENSDNFTITNTLIDKPSHSLDSGPPACPFLYIFLDNQYTYLDGFLHGFISKEKEDISFTDITETEIINGKVKLKMTEELNETTYLDRMYLRVDEDNDSIIELKNITGANISLLKYSDDNYLIMEIGDEYSLEFDVPEDYSKLEFVTEGYYIEEHNTKYGIYATGSEYGVISGVNGSANDSDDEYGIYLTNSNYITIESCNMTDWGDGIYLNSSSNNTLQDNTASSNTNGIYLNSSSNNNQIMNNTVSSNTGKGIYLESSSNNTLQDNTASSNTNGVYLESSSNNTFQNNTVSSNTNGVYLESSSNNNRIMNNTLNSNSYGINISSSSNNNFSSNTLSKNINLVQMNNYTNNFTLNKFLKNFNSLSIFSTSSQNSTTGNRIDFNITMKYVNGSDCSSCSYKLDLYPSELNFQNSSSNELIEGNFTPTKTGIYSLKINITDENNNSEIRKYVYLINVTSDLVNYYFRSAEPTHGQPLALWGNDSGSLLFEKPSSEESRNCGNWVQFSPDILPGYLLGIYKEINYSMWYEITANANNWTGVQRYATYNNVVDYNVTVSAASKTFESFNFTVDWASDYFWSGYWRSIKLRGSSPYIYSNSTDPSYANITYVYSNTPAIREISNEDVELLSAVMTNNNSGIANLTFNGEGTTNLSVEMPNSSAYYYVLYDDVNCEDNSNCTINSQSNGIVNLTLDLGNEHNVSLISDEIKPVVNLTSPSSGVSYSGSSYSVNFIFNVTDDSTIVNCSVYANSVGYLNSSAITKGANNTISVTLSAGSYAAYVNCTDGADNVGNSSVISFSVVAPSSSSSSSGGDGTSSFYKKTIVQDEEEFSEVGELTKELEEKERIRIKINNKKHYIGVVGLEEDSVVVNISSTVQQAKFYVGDEKKFEVTDDNYYDIYIKLNSIENNKANLTVKSIYEEMPEVVGEGVEEKVEREILEKETCEKINWFFYLQMIVVVLVVLGVFFAVVFLIKKQKRKKAILFFKKKWGGFLKKGVKRKT